MSRYLFYAIFFCLGCYKAGHIGCVDMNCGIFTLMSFKKFIQIGMQKTFQPGSVYMKHPASEDLNFGTSVLFALLEIHYIKLYILRHCPEIVEHDTHHTVRNADIRNEMKYSHLLHLSL